MNKVHTAVIAHVRASAQGGSKKLVDKLAELSDEQLCKLMFSSYRGQGSKARGLRLTTTGVELMLRYYGHFEVKLPDDRIILAGEILYLDRHATLPYYCSNKRIVVFETELGMKLKLWGGDIARIAEIEAF